MAALLWKYWLGWVIAFVLVGPYSFFRFYNAYPRWTQGRPFVQALVESLGGEAEENPHASRR
jgi:hypothetical protein